MPGTTAVDLGKRIAAAHGARKLTQQNLADLSATSLSMIRKMEQGRRTPSDDVLQAVADALVVTPEHLLDGPGHSECRVHLAIPAIQQAIAEYDLPEDGPVRPLNELTALVKLGVEQRMNAQYATLAAALPPLLAELARAVDQCRGADRQCSAGLLTAVYRSADAVAYKHGYGDLSGRLIELMRWAAGIAEDPALDAAAAYVRTEVFLLSGSLSTGLRALQQAIDAAPPHSSAQMRAAIGSLHMRAAVVAGRMRDAGAARDHLASAAGLISGMREATYAGTAVGPDSLQIHTLAVAVELNEERDLRETVASAMRWAPPCELPAERRSHYYIDLGRAQMRLGRPLHARESLEVARTIAPQHVREHGQVRAELATMVRLSRGRDERLLTFARWAKAV
ncbi:helix-turn-helix domain-containing protein [Kitasatospora sp. NPDC050543]|uniref:helix-turn-helix domain-containing protein n=1 Tax=Kitasatospora sp. NPDC050543 TaxID=3364054 RepID=UPI00379129AA